MNDVSQDNQQAIAQAKPNNDREINFRKQEQAIKEKYERELSIERSARLEAERKYQEASAPKNRQYDDDDDDYNEPYVEPKRLKREQQKLAQQIKQDTQTDIQKAVQTAIQEERKQNWIKSNPDFFEVLQHADKFYENDPELADTILTMPEGFERQKLVYKNIKALGLHKEKQAVSSIQSTIDSNKRSPFYQPGGLGTVPYTQQADFSQSGQQSAYAKMKELQSRMRL